MMYNLADLLAPEAKSKQVQLNLDFASGEVLVKTRGNVLNSIFENILRNAIRYTNDNTEVRITIAPVGNTAVRVAVLDQGPGVPEQYVDRIFEPFFRADSARSRDRGGYGLGLAIADRTVAVHEGSISAKNRPEGGLVLEVILPALPDSFAAEDNELLPV
jgi:two-component system sensor histidine kinase CpxA